MDIRENITVVFAAWCLSCCTFELEATPLTDLLNRFSSLPHVSGELGEQIEAARQEFAYCARVEDRDPWDFFAKRMSRIYLFFKEYALGPIGAYFPLETPAEPMLTFTKSHWWAKHGYILLALLEKIRNLAETEELPAGLREELQNFLQEATAFIQAIYDENQRIYLEEQATLEWQMAQIRLNFEEYIATIPDDLKEAFRYCWRPNISDPEVDVIEILDKNEALGIWQCHQSLTPYLPNEADRNQFFVTSGSTLAEATARACGAEMPYENKRLGIWQCHQLLFPYLPNEADRD